MNPSRKKLAKEKMKFRKELLMVCLEKGIFNLKQLREITQAIIKNQDKKKFGVK